MVFAIAYQRYDMEVMTMSMNANVVANSSTQVAAAYAERKTSRVTTGKTIGNPELSEKGQKYYEELKKKFGNMDFILVSPDMKEQAEANASAYASPNRTVVLIDTEKIEKMAEDEGYRKKYEGIISNAQNQISRMQSSLSTSGANVKSYGIKINDGGTASFFAVIDKSLAAQKERIEAKAEKRAQEKKEAAKELAEKRAEERKAEQADGGDTVTITASSVEELLQRINDYVLEDKSNNVETQEEKMVGRSIDFSI